MSYYFTFLFPIYMKPVYACNTDEQKQDCVDKRGSNLSCRTFRSTLNELLESLYMHVHALADIENAVEKKDQEDFANRVDKNSISTFSIGLHNQSKQKVPFDFRVIRFEEPGVTMEYNYM